MILGHSKPYFTSCLPCLQRSRCRKHLRFILLRFRRDLPLLLRQSNRQNVLLVGNAILCHDEISTRLHPQSDGLGLGPLLQCCSLSTGINRLQHLRRKLEYSTRRAQFLHWRSGHKFYFYRIRGSRHVRDDDRRSVFDGNLQYRWCHVLGWIKRESNHEFGGRDISYCC